MTPRLAIAPALTLLLSFAAFATPPSPSTFSIVAADPESGEVGVAVASRFFAVGSVVPFAKAGVGAVATQSFANTTYGPRGLELLERGVSADEVVLILTRSDDGREQRQLGRRDGGGCVGDVLRHEVQSLGGWAQRAELRGAGKHPHRRTGRGRDGEGVSRIEGEDARRTALRRDRRRR